MASKSAEAFRTISEVAERLQVPAHVLRFWESRFTQIKPVKRGGGRRYYRPQDVHLLLGIQKLLHGEHLTIKGAQKIIREKGVRHVIDLGEARDVAAVSPTAVPRAPVSRPAAAPKDPDLFGATAPPPPRAPAHRPFPPDPARINPKAEQLRRVLGKMISLRDRMKAASA